MENVKNSEQSCWQVMAVEVEQRNEQKPGRGNLGDEDDHLWREINEAQERWVLRDKALHCGHAMLDEPGSTRRGCGTGSDA